MTLTEFLHPLRRSSKPEQVQAALYYLKHHEGRDALRVREIRAVLVQAGVPRARGANIAQALVRSAPRVHQIEDGFWALTSTGEDYVRQRLSIGTDTRADADIGSLETLARGIADEATRGYVNEAVECLQVGARRAAVVFLWSGAVAAIRNEVWTHGPRQIEAALQRLNPKAKFRKKDDFSAVKDIQLLTVAQELGIYDKSEKKHLQVALDLRNDCGHPVKYRPGEKKVSSFIEDVVGIVFA